VYANRNFLPFFLTGSLAHFGSGVEHYGEWNMYSVVDGQGVYITRNLDYEGHFSLTDNIAFDNGINGVVVHKTTHDNVQVTVKGNIVFENGKTRKVEESRQTAGGLTINSGDYTSTQLLEDNQVSVQDGDVTYQCFGTCVLSAGSGNNTACGGSVSNKIDSATINVDTDCTVQNEDFASIKAMYTDSQMPICAQYTPFLEDPALQNLCTEPLAGERPCCNCHISGNRCNPDSDTCCHDPNNLSLSGVSQAFLSLAVMIALLFQ